MILLIGGLIISILTLKLRERLGYNLFQILCLVGFFINIILFVEIIQINNDDD
jgi:hypothetical protein